MGTWCMLTVRVTVLLCYMVPCARMEGLELKSRKCAQVNIVVARVTFSDSHVSALWLRISKAMINHHPFKSVGSLR